MSFEPRDGASPHKLSHTLNHSITTLHVEMPGSHLREEAQGGSEVSLPMRGGGALGERARHGTDSGMAPRGMRELLRRGRAPAASSLTGSGTSGRAPAAGAASHCTEQRPEVVLIHSSGSSVGCTRRPVDRELDFSARCSVLLLRALMRSLGNKRHAVAGFSASCVAGRRALGAAAALAA